MQSENKILDDFARLASGAMGVAVGMRSEVEARLREQLERLLAQMDLVPREEFDAMKAVAIAAREEQEALTQKLAALEGRLAALEGGKAAAPKRSAKKAAAKKESDKKDVGEAASPASES
ncbi:MAG TPA: accessory factor UbiK family protein [Kiloniellaceae bacterium]|nr:accessory factor UbiK family protein [Kiloniellaceae bacterium]HIP80398.1 accessory factor UbiK family protein [Kiloniellaceae bacterium]